MLAEFAGRPGIAAEKKAEWAFIDAGFANPPAEFRFIQYSKHDGALLPYAKMQDAGIGGVMLFMQSAGYLTTEEAWQHIGKNIAAAQEAGLQIWVADDNGYPSGMAGGRVVEADPAFENRGLREVSKDGNGPGPVRIDLPPQAEKFAYAFLYPLVEGVPVLEKGTVVPVQADRVETNGLEGSWRLCAFALQIIREGTQAESTKSGFQTSGRYPNLLDPAAMEKFVSLTHEEYARRFGPLKGKVTGFYANEPNLMTLWFKPGQHEGGASFVPWQADLPRRFQEQHGYDLLPLLPALYGGDDPSSKLVRRHFYETVGRMLSENFSVRIGSWAEKNGVEAGGHPLLEESMLHHVIGYGDFFRFVEPMHAPACDLPMPDGNAYLLDCLHFGAPHNTWMPKFLSSVAQAANRETVIGLLDPMISRPFHDLKLPPEKVRRIVNLAALGGVNQFMNYFYWYEYDPAVYRTLNEYIGRLCLVLHGARSAATVGVYYPIETFQAEFLPSSATWSREFWPKAWDRMEQRIRDQDEVVRSLFLQGIDFTWLHGDWIEKARVEKGWLVAAHGRYRTIVMPEVELLPLAVARKLEEFEKGGGKVIWVKSLPQLGETPEEHEKVKAMFAKKKIVSPGRVAEAIGTALPPGFTLETGPEVLTARFVRDDRRVTYLVNYQADKVTVPVKLASGEKQSFDVYNPMDGTIQAQTLPGPLTIPGNASLLVVEPARSADR
jgi:hypothetical protein